MESTTNTTITGRVKSHRGRRPKTNPEDRICAESGCETKLNRYNLKDKCLTHQSPSFPRIRGHKPSR